MLDEDPPARPTEFPASASLVLAAQFALESFLHTANLAHQEFGESQRLRVAALGLFVVPAYDLAAGIKAVWVGVADDLEERDQVVYPHFAELVSLDADVQP